MAGRTVRNGYGLAHKKLRLRLTPFVASGRAVYARCGKPIAPHQLWDIDHCGYNRNAYLGPSHRRCNRATATRRARQQAQAPRANALSFFD
jgi:hypothetical protein